TGIIGLVFSVVDVLPDPKPKFQLPRRKDTPAYPKIKPSRIRMPKQPEQEHPGFLLSFAIVFSPEKIDVQK
ncbi:MAG TPA: hypothetical protein V6C58_07715, partial [Allocoleopsis sp.]